MTERVDVTAEREHLIETILAYDPEADTQMLSLAYDYAKDVHKKDIRKSGEPYFMHPLAVANILAELKLDDATVATGLLHDTVEDTEATLDKIDKLFGHEIRDLVDGVTKIEKLDLSTKKAKQAENFRKLLVAFTTDIRVLLVKLADRLHNMRTMKHMKASAQKRISEETLDIYAPLAARLGIHWVREELEEHAFRWLHPEAYKAVMEKLDKRHLRDHDLVAEISDLLKGVLRDNGIEGEVTGREKKPFSIWKKMEGKQISFEELSDIYAFRVIVPSVDDCYKVLGLIHTRWPIVPGFFKDYISLPKRNDYQSIHTKVVGPHHQRVELQIRTFEMHEIAEYGIAAHALYKEQPVLDGEKLAKRTDESQVSQWLRKLVDMLRDGQNSETLYEHTKMELYKDQVFCFTPKGRIIVLPYGATPLDFAYAVHTDLGNSFLGCKINGQHKPRMTQLRNGDKVEIIRSEEQTVDLSWDNWVVTGKARSAIRRAVKETKRKHHISWGRQLLKRAFDREQKKFSDSLLLQNISRLPQDTIDDVFQDIGIGDLSSETVLDAVYRDERPEVKSERQEFTRKEKGWRAFANKIGIKYKQTSFLAENGNRGGSISIGGSASQLPVSYAPKGGAVPGDRIVGVLAPNKGITIYPIQSIPMDLLELSPDLLIDVTWDIEKDSTVRFPAQIEVVAINEPGTLVQIAQVISDEKGNIHTLTMLDTAPDYTKMRFELEVLDIKHLMTIIKGVGKISVVNSVERTFN